MEWDYRHEKNSTYYHGINSICNKAMECFKPLKCKEASDYRDDAEKLCDSKINNFPDNQNCIISFFVEAYSAQSSPCSCFSKYDFLHSNLTRRRTAYQNGKECIMEYVRKNCEEISVDYFSKRYEKLANAFSTQPSVHNCTDEHHQLKHLQCQAALLETKNRIDKLQLFDGLFGSSRVKDVVKACKDTEMCIQEDDCFTSTDIPRELDRIPVCGNRIKFD